MPRPAHPSLAAVAAAVLLSAPALHAQVEQRSLRLNDPVLASQYVTILDKTDLQPSGAITIEAWVSPTSYSGFPTIVGNNFLNSYWLGLNTTGHIRFYPKGGVGLFFESVSTVPLNAWTHIAATYDGTTTSLYVSGQLDASSGAITGAIGTDAGDLRVGADRSGGSPAFFWRGYLDEIRIWTVARSGPQIRSTMFDGCGRPIFASAAYAGLEAWWANDYDQLSTMTDIIIGASHTSNVGSYVNGPTRSIQAPPVSYNTGLLLNGVDDYLDLLTVGDGFANGLTIEAWVAPYSYAGFPTIVGRDYRTSFWLGLNPSGQIRFYPTGGVSNYVESAPIVPLNQWSHVAATYAGGVTRIYINGNHVLVSTAITGPVGENGLAPRVGADRESGVPTYFFNGILDEVRVVRGALGAGQIKKDRFIGYTDVVSPIPVLDDDGVSRDLYHVDMDQSTAPPYAIAGSGARFVRSGAPTSSLVSSDIAFAGLEGYHFDLLPVLGGNTLPDGTGGVLSIGTDLFVSENVPISSVRVFVSAPTTNLLAVSARVRSPAMTFVDLVAPGTAPGRDLHTVFSDGAALTLATGVSPYSDGVRPAAALSVLNGEMSGGLWRFVIATSPPYTVGLWAWGVQINGLAVGVDSRTSASVVSLVNTGANPVRSAGSMKFDLPRAARMELALFDVQGRKLRTLMDGFHDAGSYTLGWSAAGIESGLYFVRLKTDTGEERMLRVSVVH